jgi:hypothetical protein
MVVVAVEDLDIDSRLRHPPREHAQLTRYVLLQSLHEHFTVGEHPDTCGFECLARGVSIREQEMGDAAAVHDPGASALDAHAGTTQSLAHVGKGGASHTVMPRPFLPVLPRK